MIDLREIPEIQEVHTGDIPVTMFSEIQLLSADITDDMIRYHITKTVHDMARRSRTLLRRVRLCLGKCVTEYKIDLPQDELFIAFQEKHQHQRAAGTRTFCGGYQVEWNASSCQVRISPEPCTPSDIELVIATAPKISACELDECYLNQHYSTIMHGLKSMFYAMKGENVDWSDGSLATFHDQKFQSGLIAARVDLITGYGSAPVPMQAPRIL